MRNTTRVAAAQHAGRVGQDVGPTLEHEGHDAERRADQLDREVLLRHALEHLPAPARRVDPAAQPFDHPAAHGVRRDEPGRRAAAALCIARSSWLASSTSAQTASDSRRAAKCSKKRDSTASGARLTSPNADRATADRLVDEPPFGRGDEQHLLARLDHRQRVAGPKALGHVVWNRDQAVATAQQLRALGQRGQRGGLRHGVMLVAAARVVKALRGQCLTG